MYPKPRSQTSTPAKEIIPGALAILLSLVAGCATHSPSPEVREVTGSDPIAAVFSNCSELFSTNPSSADCEFTEDRGPAGADVVREKISCLRTDQYVKCRGRPGEGPGPEEYRLDFRCSIGTRQCEIISGAPSYVEAFTPLFESYNREVARRPQGALPEP
jgi:hypothetical protein